MDHLRMYGRLEAGSSSAVAAASALERSQCSVEGYLELALSPRRRIRNLPHTHAFTLTAVFLKRGRSMARNVAAWTRLECEGAEVAFREHWGGFVEIACGDSRVMLCHCGVERLTRLPPQSALAFLMKLLKAARVEQRNRVQVDLLSAVLERSIQSGRPTAPRE
jgi:hypothetical protein